MNDHGFIITGSLSSRKGIEISQSPKVALSFWRTTTERQVRIQGIASRITEGDADQYFKERSRYCQLLSTVSKQGEVIAKTEDFTKRIELLETKLNGKGLKRPEDWSGYNIRPLRIEFFAFRSNRIHERKLFEFMNEEWIMKQLQP